MDGLRSTATGHAMTRYAWSVTSHHAVRIDEPAFTFGAIMWGVS